MRGYASRDVFKLPCRPAARRPRSGAHGRAGWRAASRAASPPSEPTASRAAQLDGDQILPEAQQREDRGRRRRPPIRPASCLARPRRWPRTTRARRRRWRAARSPYHRLGPTRRRGERPPERDEQDADGGKHAATGVTRDPPVKRISLVAAKPSRWYSGPAGLRGMQHEAVEPLAPGPGEDLPHQQLAEPVAAPLGLGVHVEHDGVATRRDAHARRPARGAGAAAPAGAGARAGHDAPGSSVGAASQPTYSPRARRPLS